jgi:uncharacterized protein (TIGR02646 family)
MKHVQRGMEPPELTEWKASANADWKPTYRDYPHKKALVLRLAREQGYLCGYCGGRIGAREGDCHVEHVDSQSKHEERRLDYTNMLGSCQGSEATPPVPAHCGHTRRNEPLPVTPFMPDCADYFTYGSDGSIGPADAAHDEPAKTTITLLGLGVRRLRASRLAAIDAALQGLDLLSGDEWRAEAAAYDFPDAEGRLSPYCFAVKQVLLRNA